MGVQKALEHLTKSKEALAREETAPALILVDQALEYFLKNCCIFLGATENTKTTNKEGKEKEFNRWGFTEYMNYLDEHNFLTIEEKSNFFMFHNWRNPVQHIGLEPSKKQVQLVISFVDDFFASQIEARKQAHVLPPDLRRFTQTLKELDPDSRIVQIDGLNNQVTYSKDIRQHRKISKLTPEELIRAYLVTSLITQKHYPIDSIELEKSYKVGRKEKETEARIDVLINKNNLPFMLIEVKRQERYEPELTAQIETQLYATAHLEDPQGKNMRYLIYYTADATEQAGITDRATIIDFQHYHTFESWEKDGQPNLLSIPIEYGIVRKPVFIKDSEQDLKINVSRKELEGLRWNIHNILYGGGKYQTELFFNLLGILLAKIYDEKTTQSKQPYTFQIFYKNGDMETPEEVYTKVDKLYRDALKELIGYTENDLAKEKGIVFDPPKVKYVVDRLQGISITSNTYDVLGDFFEKIVWQEFKQSKGQYFTHPNIVNFIIRVLELDKLAVKLVENEHRLPYIIDASCGSGTYLIEAMKLVTSTILENAETLKKSQMSKEFVATNFPLAKENWWANKFIFGVEINKDLAMATKVNMVMHGDGSANVEAKDALIGFNSYKSLLGKSQKSTTYSKPVNEQFDVAISNPPFSITIEPDTAKTLPDNFEQGEKIANKLKKDTKKKEVNVETLFIERWYQLLKPNGRLGVVLPENIFDSTENRIIRLFLFKHFKIKAVVSLPDLAFQPYTSTKTSLLFAQKKTPAEVEEYTKDWKALEEEFIKLKNHVELAIRKKTSLDTYTVETAYDLPSLFAKMLHDRFESSDSTLGTTELINKYVKTIKEVDSDWWVFAEMSKTINYPIFMAHANEIGYKRVLHREISRPNGLFQKGKQEIMVDKEKPTTILDYARINVQWE
jgi:type I restriction enzyme M protein